jgi:hypothetical protein
MHIQTRDQVIAAPQLLQIAHIGNVPAGKAAGRAIEIFQGGAVIKAGNAAKVRVILAGQVQKGSQASPVERGQLVIVAIQ